MTLSPFQYNKAQAEDPGTPLGLKYCDPYGRTFRLAKAAGTALARGKISVNATQDAEHDNLSFATAPVLGATEVSVTIGTSAITKNEYKDGWLVVQDGAGEGRAYPIEGHEAIGSAGTGTFVLAEPIDTLGVISQTNVDLVKNIYQELVISATDQADLPVGVPVVAVAADYFFMAQTSGPCAVLMDEAIASGLTVTIGTGVAGAVEALDAAGEPIVGTQITTGVDTEYQLINLKLE